MDIRSLSALREPLEVGLLAARSTGPAKPWRALEVVTETGSTNADLLARSVAGVEVAGSVLVAEYQRAGRGRHGRQWIAPPRSQLAVSVGVAVESVPAARWGWLPLAAGMAVVDAIFTVSGISAGLKWPNDVLARESGGKLAGVLAEVATNGVVIVVGVGLNVTLTTDERPDPAATSLLMLGARNLDRADVLVGLLDALARRIDQWRGPDAEHRRLVDDYLRHSITHGSRVAAVLPGGRRVVGLATGVDEFGRIRIESGAESLLLSAADITHLRPLSDVERR